MVIAEIAASLGSIKTALDILKGLKKSEASSSILSEIADLQSALIEVQQGIMTANQTHTADVDRIRDLEKEVARLKAWDGEKERYELKAVYPGAFAYALKIAMAAGEPPHWLCVPCYQEGKKSLLQQGVAWDHGTQTIPWQCPTCDATIRVSYQVKPG